MELEVYTSSASEQLSLSLRLSDILTEMNKNIKKINTRGKYATDWWHYRYNCEPYVFGGHAVSCAAIHSRFQKFPWSHWNACVRWTLRNYQTFTGNLTNIQPKPNKNCGPVFAIFAIFCKGGFLEEKVLDENTLNTSSKLCRFVFSIPIMSKVPLFLRAMLLSITSCPDLLRILSTDFTQSTALLQSTSGGLASWQTTTPKHPKNAYSIFL